MAPTENIDSLPGYAPSTPSPSYTCEPTEDEQTLQKMPVLGSPPPTGTYTKESEKVVVTLFDQETGAEIPTYGRRGLIRGTIYFGNMERVSQVMLKVEGYLNLTSSEGGSQSTKLINDCHALWNRKDNKPSPNLIPFSCALPPSYEHDGFQHPLPPSYTSSHTGAYTVLVSSHYSIKVYVKRALHCLVGQFLTATKQIKIPFRYHPRIRPHRPILARSEFFSAVKAFPGEWFQALSEIKTRPTSQLDHIYCHLFVPAVRVYALTDTISFHVQLYGRTHSLKSFLMLPQPDSCCGLQSSLPTLCSSHPQPAVRVYLLRQVGVDIRGYKALRNTIIAEAQLREIPPTHFSRDSQETTHLDWEGEVKCGHEISVGSFAANNVFVKDFIGIGIKPPACEHGNSQFLDFQMRVPIRLVSDPYVEVTDYGTDEA